MKKNIFENIPKDIPSEIFESIIESDSVRIERIIAKGQNSPKNFWYDQKKNEWVIMLKGKAQLQIEDHEAIELNVGDYIDIPAHQKHRVEWTDPNNETIWLVVFY